MYYAIKSLWVKPKLVNYIIAKEIGESKDVIEEQELDLQTSKIRGIYFFIIAIALLIITKLRMQPELQADAISMNPVFIFIGVIIILIWLVLDIYRRKIRYILIQDDSAISCYDLDYYSYYCTFIRNFQ